MSVLRGRAPLLGLSLGLLATVACGSSSAPGDRAITVDAGAAVDAPGSDDVADAQADAGSPDAGPELYAVPLSVCGPELVYVAGAAIGGSSGYQLLVDTGSTTLGVASSSCSSCDVNHEYTPSAEATNEHQTATSYYGTGSWSGDIYKDETALGMAATDVKLAAIQSQQGFFQLFSCGTVDGVVGFGPAGAALPGTNAFFDDLVASSNLPNVFATKLCDDGGTLWLGGYDPSATTAAPQYVPLTGGVLSRVYYSVTLTSVEVDGTTVPIATSEQQDSVVDTGTAGFLLQTTAYDALTQALQSDAAFASALGSTFFESGGEGVACAPSGASKATLDATLPSLTLHFGSVSVKALPTESYLFSYQGEAWCSALITDPSVSAELPIAAIIGSPILRSNIVVFDRANKRIGFAPHTACP